MAPEGQLHHRLEASADVTPEAGARATDIDRDDVWGTFWIALRPDEAVGIDLWLDRAYRLALGAYLRPCGAASGIAADARRWRPACRLGGRSPVRAARTISQVAGGQDVRTNLRNRSDLTRPSSRDG